MAMNAECKYILLLLWLVIRASSFLPRSVPFRNVKCGTQHYVSDVTIIIANSDDDDDMRNDEDDEELDEEDVAVDDLYQTFAASEFVDGQPDEDKNLSSSIVASSSALATPNTPTTSLDWGGALGKLRERVDDIETGKSQDPSHTLFRLLSSQAPSQQISNFVSSASPKVVSAMSGAISGLLGGLASSPMSGFDTIVKANGEKLGSLCFQLQMTGYMFRNAEYVMALKGLMKIKGSATLQDYKEAFDELDSDGSGYIEANEIQDLLDSVYDGKTPGFEIEAFLTFFDTDKDGRISWKEFEHGLGRAMAEQNQHNANLRLLGHYVDDEEDDDYINPGFEPEIEGTVEVELEDGKVVPVKAKEYVDSLKQEVRALKASLRREKGLPEKIPNPLPGMNKQLPGDAFGGITDYIARSQGDLKSLTEGISPEIVQTMKMLVDFVMDKGDRDTSSGRARKGKKRKEDLEMQLTASALQQLALWQLILGYRLREAEVKGEYLRLLE